MSSVLFLSCLALIAPSVITTDELDARIREVEQARKSCGPRAVWYCLRRFGRDVPLATVYQDAGLNIDGSSLRGLLVALQKYDIPAEAVMGNPGRIGELPIPSILVIDDKHCVVYEGLESAGQTVRYFEPSEGRIRTSSIEAFRREWTGQAIVFDVPQMSTLAFTKLVLLGAMATWLLAGLGLAVVRSLRSLGHRLARAFPVPGG